MGTPPPATWCSTSSDDTAPWNAGRWHLHVGDAGEAEVERTDDEPHLRLSAQALGALYLGGVSPALLAGRRRARGAAPGRRDRALWHAVRTDARPAASVGF